MQPAAVGDDDGEHDLVRPWRIVEANLHRIVVRADEGGVLEVQRDVDRRAGSAELLGGGNARLAAVDRRAQRRAQLGMQEGGGVLVLAGLTHDGALAERLRRCAERLYRFLREQRAELLARVDERREVLDEPPRERVLDDGHRRHLAQGTAAGAATVAEDLLHHRDRLSDLHAHASAPNLWKTSPSSSFG